MRPAPKMADEGYVYFITFDYKTVKIGFTKDPQSRFPDLQTASHLDMEKLGCYRAFSTEEGRIHALLKKYRVKREWFRYTAPVEKLVDDLADAHLLLKFQYGQDYDGTLHECLEYEDAGRKLGAIIDWGHQNGYVMGQPP